MIEVFGHRQISSLLIEHELNYKQSEAIYIVYSSDYFETKTTQQQP